MILSLRQQSLIKINNCVQNNHLTIKLGELKKKRTKIDWVPVFGNRKRMQQSLV